MTVALYRRYRPDTFADVIGQEHVTDLLKNALDSGRASHAYLFSGPRGCGKTTSARIMARCLNCVEGPTSTPCGKCQSCVELAAGGSGSLDVVEIDAASNSGVDDARELRERAGFAPTRDRYKIFILDEAHMVTKGGFNALLKLVEEPPEHAKFIFATTEPEKVIGTIRSRTHHYPFRLVAPSVLEAHLADVCAKEGISVEPGVLPLVVAAGGGSVRDSLSVLDQLIAGAGGQQLELAQATDLLGFTDTALLDKTMDSLGANDGAGVFQAIEEMAETGQDPRRFAEDLLQRVRDVLICAVAPTRAQAILPHIPADQLERMFAQAGAWGSRLLSRRADLIDEALREMGGATSPRLQVELLMGRLLLAGSEQEAPQGTPPAQASAPRPAVPAAPAAPAAASRPASRPQKKAPTPNHQPAPSHQPAADSQPAPEGAPATEETPAPPAPASKPSPAPEPAPAAADLSAVKERWSDVLAAAEQLSRVSGALLRNVEVIGVTGTVLTVATSDSLAQRFQPGLSDFENLQSAVRATFGEGWSATFSAGQEASPAPTRRAVPPPTSDGQPEPDAGAPPATQSAGSAQGVRPASNNGWGPVAVPGRGAEPAASASDSAQQRAESEGRAHPKVPAEPPAPGSAPQTREHSPSGAAADPMRGPMSGPARTAAASPTAPLEDPTPNDPPTGAASGPAAGPNQPDEAVSSDLDEPAQTEDWDQGVSWEDATIESPVNSSLPLLLETLGGTVIETIKDEPRQ